MGHTKSASDSINPVGGGAQDNFGRLLRVSTATVGFGDSTAVEVGTFPAGAVIHSIIINVTTAFDAGTTNTLDIGTGTDADAFVVDESVGSAGVITATLDGADLSVTTEDTVEILYEQSGTAATAGSADVHVCWIAPEDS